MPDPLPEASSYRTLKQEDVDSFASLGSEGVTRLREIAAHLPLRDELAYQIAMASQPEISLVRSPVVQELATTRSFQNLLRFVLDSPKLREAYVPIPSPSGDRDSLVEFYIKAMLLLNVCKAHVLSAGREPRPYFVGLAQFLDLPEITRQVTVPLFHLTLSKDAFELGTVGVLKKAQVVSIEDAPKETTAHSEHDTFCTLEFRVSTGRFVSAHTFPLAWEILWRVTLIRLVSYPLVSFNHFEVEYSDRWESPLRDTDFAGRFWAKAPRRLELNTAVLTDGHVQEIGSLYDKFMRLKWDMVMPLRLALDRLNDATFKLECGSPDSILDIVIGLESLFVEPESRQESTHKVATRTARFLEDTKLSRREIFRDVKEIYKLRSTLAHGQTWKLDDQAVSQVEHSALVLARALRRAVQLGQTEVDLMELDLG